MLMQEVFSLIVIAAIVAVIYKFRDPLMGWVKTKPRIFKDGVLRDLDTLKKYGIKDANSLIVKNERDWEEAKITLERDLKAMRKELKDKFDPEEKKGG